MNEILVISGQYNYTTKVVDQKNADLTYSLYKYNKYMKILERIWWLLKIPYFHIFFPFAQKDIWKYKYVILFECHYPVETVSYIRKNNPTCQIIYWIWNSIEKMKTGKKYSLADEIKKLILMQTKYKIKVYSFDRNDCEKYKIRYNNQICMNFNKMPKSIKYDVYFCGIDKKRLEILRSLDSVFCNNNLIFKCELLLNKEKKYTRNDEKYLIYNEIDYETLLENELASKCILDLIQEGQGGLTWRPLEAMFYKKKLITNYINIRDYDFYCKENIFILGIDHIDDISRFINSKYKDVPKKIIDQYEWNGWIKKIKNDCIHGKTNK